MASIINRGPYQWRVVIRRKGWQTQSKTFNTRADAERWARMIENEQDRGVFVSHGEAERTTLAEAIDRYLREITPTKKSAYTEKRRLSVWLRNPLAKRTLANLRGTDFAQYRDTRRAAGLANDTIRRDLAPIAHLFEVARKDWGMESLVNPLRNIRMPGLSRGRDRRLLSTAELDGIIAASSSRELPAFVRLAAETAMRSGELCKLHWKHIDLSRRIAYLPDTKNGESRTVPLSSSAVAILQSLPRRLDGRVFILKPSVFTKAFLRACLRARRQYEDECREKGIHPDPDLYLNLRLHDLRHEATSRLFEKGLNAMEVASVTGHKTLQMLKRYTHLRAEELAKKLG